MKIKNILFSWDLILSLFATVIVYCAFPIEVVNDFLRDIYGIGISVLSIVFSVFFAALAIIISSGDNEFINFIESNGNHFTKIISSFKFSLLLLFIALLYSISIYIFTSNLISDEKLTQPIFYFIVFIFLFSYSLFATVNSAQDALQYAKYRTKYLIVISKSKKKNNYD